MKRKERLYETEAINYLRSEIEFKQNRNYKSAFTPFFAGYLDYAKENNLTISSLTTARAAINPNRTDYSNPKLVEHMFKYCGKEVKIIKKSA